MVAFSVLSDECINGLDNGSRPSGCLGKVLSDDVCSVSVVSTVLFVFPPNMVKSVGHDVAPLQCYSQPTIFMWYHLSCTSLRVRNYRLPSWPWQAIFLSGRQISPLFCPTGSQIVQPQILTPNPTLPKSRKVREQQPKRIWKMMLDWL